MLKKIGRPSYQRKSYPKKNTTTEVPITEPRSRNSSIISSAPTIRSALPRTSYYNRSRNNRNNVSSSTTSTTESTEEIISEKDIAQNKKVDTIDMPLIFTLLKNPVNVEEKGKSKEEDKEMFVIAVTSKESQDNGMLKENLLNDVSNTAEESENNPIYNTSPTIKYHANYKDLDVTISDNEQQLSSTVPPVKNIQTRKYARKRTKTFDQYEDLEAPNPREKGIRKLSEPYSKTTEASTNGVSY